MNIDEVIEILRIFTVPVVVLIILIMGPILYVKWATNKMNKTTSKKKFKTINGKLIRKVKDNNEETRNILNLRRNYYGMKRLEKKDVKKYYITFETSKGIRSFTVNYRVYRTIQIGQEGVITVQGKRFVSFEKKQFGL